MSEINTPKLIQVNIKDAMKLSTVAVRSGRVLMLKGSPAAGKSAVAKSLAREYNLELIDFRLAQAEPSDLLGFPSVDRDANKAGYVPMDTFPLKGDPLPDGKSGWLLFCDEMNSANRDVQKAAYKLMLDRMVGNFDLHERCAVMAAGNLDTDGAIVEEMSTALQSRMIHLELVVDPEAWLEWAADNHIDHRITSFINFKPTSLYTFNPDHSDVTYASPRTWEFASDLLKNIEISDPLCMSLMAGTIGEGEAREFMAYTRIFEKLPTIDDVKRDPHNAPVPDEPSVQYAMIGALSAHMNNDNCNGLLTYLKRLPVEFQVTCLRESYRRNPDLMETQAFSDWITEKAEDLF